MSEQTDSPVEDYFNRKSRAYQQRSEGWLWSLTRRREREACLALLEPRRGETILDAGSGAGYYTKLLARAGAKVWAVDLSERMAAEARKAGAVEARQGDLANVELGRTFDKILCAGALEFCADTEAVICNLARHLAPGGCLVILAPRRSPGGWFYKLFHRTHGLRVTLFTPGELREIGLMYGLRPGPCARPAFSLVMRLDKTA